MNSDQIAYWNGAAGERWTREQEALDHALAPFTAKLFHVAALRPGERVLDVGCGCGTPTLAAAAAVGEAGAVVGVDVSAPMLGRAVARSGGRANVSYRLEDAATARHSEPFDAEISRFGVMFFDDPLHAFANLRSALRTGGRLTFVCWRTVAENEWVRVPQEVAVRYLAPDPPAGPDAPGPFSFGDPQRVRRIIEGAGFSGVHVAPFDADVILSEEGVTGAADFAMATGPTARLLRDASDEEKERVRAALETTLSPFTRHGRTALGGAVWIVNAAA
jgi:SAM-dependent methyltransferase